MKLSDYVAQFLRDQGIKHVFAITGGASVHLIDSIARTDGIDFICPAHEQAGAFAADGYARSIGGLGCAIATSGPGATNLITGIAGAYFDSIPVLFITGQQSTNRMKGDTGVRQMGFQETDIVSMVKPVTKYAVLVKDWTQLRCELERAVYLARSGRPGPVLVDIPDDLQRRDVPVEEMRAFDPPFSPDSNTDFIVRSGASRAWTMFKDAKRPVLVVGHGVRLAGAEKEIVELADRLGFPVLPSWGALDMFPADHPLLVGSFGTHATRYGNFTIQNADLILAIGARLSTRETGSPLSSFAREAKIIMVDIDPSEILKFKHFNRPIDLGIGCCDAKAFIDEMLTYDFFQSWNDRTSKKQQFNNWLEITQRYKTKFRPVTKLGDLDMDGTINPYLFVDELSDALKEDALIVCDTGCAIAWMAQHFQFKKGQRLLHDFNNTAMGWALPAAIGAAFATGRPVVCVTGDGALLMNIQEMATAKKHNLPIKLFLLNNGGHSMVQQTQDDWLGSRYHASSIEGGLAFPDFVGVAEANGWTTFSCEKNSQLSDVIDATLKHEGPVLCDVVIPSTENVIPKVRFGYPLEDMDPQLPRDEFISNMIVKPMDISLEPR